MRTPLSPMVIILITHIVGCMPGAYVTKDPGKHNKGIRYYRPKPYLFIQPATEAIEVQGDPPQTITQIDPAGKLYKITLEYLPDFSEEYAVRVRTGFGVANVSMTLEDGWNLTAINQELDSKTAENITAVADLLKAIPGLGASAGSRGVYGGSPKSELYVHASNVPIGYYEAVIARGPDGSKRLYGFRYVGFMPFAACPIDAAGASHECCADGSMQLYGLVFENEVMMFKPLGMLPRTGSTVCERPASEAAPAASRGTGSPFGFPAVPATAPGGP